MNNKTIVAAALVFAALATTACSEKKKVFQPTIPYLPKPQEATAYEATIKYNTHTQTCAQFVGGAKVDYVDLSIQKVDTITWKGAFTDGTTDTAADQLEIEFAAISGLNLGTPFRTSGSTGAPLYTLPSQNHKIGPLTPADTATGNFTVRFAEMIDANGNVSPCKPILIGGYGVHVTK